MCKQVQDYLANVPEDALNKLNDLRKLVLSSLSDAKEAVEWGMISYRVNDKPLAGIAYRKKGIMFYLMSSGIVDRYANDLGKLRTGKSCIIYRESDGLTPDHLRKLFRQMLTEVAAANRTESA